MATVTPTPQHHRDAAALARLAQAYPPRRTIRQPLPPGSLLAAILSAGKAPLGQGRHVARGTR